MENFHYCLSDESDQYAITTATNLCIIIIFLISKGSIASLLTTMWDHTDGCANKYHCASSMYLL